MNMNFGGLVYSKLLGKKIQYYFKVKLYETSNF